MNAAPSTCESCQFENPRAWRACARCGVALGTTPRRTGVSGLGSTDHTQVSAPPEMAPGQDFESLDESLDESANQDLTGETANPDAEPPLIGQLDASEAIRTGIERAFGIGSPTLVALEGERGSGKTRLLVYASEIAARMEPNVRLAYGACREGGDGAYAPFSRMLLERFGVTPSSSPSAVRAQMTTQVSKALQTTDVIAVAETTHLLGHVAGIPFPDSPFLTPLKRKPDELHKRACLAVRRLIEGDAQMRPVAVLLDNMHYAESQGWDIVGELCQAEGHLAIVVAGGAPIADKASAHEPPGGVAIGPIGPLSEADVASMLHVLLPQLEDAPEPLVAAVTHRSGGNPSAVRELVFALWEAGFFSQGSDGLTVDLSRLEAGDDLPVSMDDAIRARLERVDALERATLDRAAVVGEVFWDGALLGQMRSERDAPKADVDPLSVWPDDEDAAALNLALGRLQDKGFIEEQEASDLPGTREYRFALAGTRDAVYRELDETPLVQRHGAVARWLTVVAELRREGVAAMIAPHLEKAGQTIRAGRAYLEAAAYERSQVRTQSALRYVECALPLIPKDDVVRRIDALHEHGSLLTTLGRYDESIEAFTQMLIHAWSIGARGKGGAALNRIARAHRQRGDDDIARKMLDRALELFRAAGDLRGVASTLDDLAQVALLQGELEQATRAAGEALEIRRAHGDQRGEALSLNTIGHAALRRGDVSAAEQLFTQSLEIRRVIGDHEGMLQSHNNVGIVMYERGDREGAVTSWREGLAAAREMADRRTECILLNNVGEALIALGELDEAAESLQRAETLAGELGDKRATAEVARNLALLAVKQANDDAEETVTRAIELAKDYGGKEAIAHAYRALGTLRARTLFDATGQADRRAEECYLTSIDLFRESGSEKEAARSLADLGYHLIERGDFETAKERLREARALMRRMGVADADRIEQTLKELG